MSTPAAVFDTALAAVSSAAAGLPTELGTVKCLDDTMLLAAQHRLAQARQALDACASLVAGEVGYRSRRDLGYAGLAQREGFRTPEALIQHATGSTAREATTLIQVGTLVHQAMTDPAGAPGEVAAGESWLAAVGAAVTAGEISVAAATAIRTGLGHPSTGPGSSGPGSADGVTADQLAAAVAALLGEATDLNADELFKAARRLRDELDAAGIADRERAAYQARAFRRVHRAGGASRFILDPDLETAAYLDDLYDKLTSPRRGGPRFIDPADQAWADAILGDERSTEQYLHDAITGLLRLGVNADQNDSHQITGSRTPAVRILISADHLTEGGPGRIEGGDTPISADSVERAICTGGTISILFDSAGQPVDLGREARLFNSRQKIALAARDGGCMWGNCDRPPAWTEAHHINQWKRDHGRTDLADGILLCRHHHLLLHNNHWDIVRNGNSYWLIPPPDIDPTQTPRPLASKSAALHDLQRETSQREKPPGTPAQTETA
jgi:hypothetical protein